MINSKKTIIIQYSRGGGRIFSMGAKLYVPISIYRTCDFPLTVGRNKKINPQAPMVVFWLTTTLNPGVLNICRLRLNSK